MSEAPRREQQRVSIITIAACPPGADLDDIADKKREVERALGRSLKPGEPFDPWEPFVMQHSCLVHGCTICGNFCNDNDAHGCQVCTTGPCGSPVCHRCFEAWGTVRPERVKNVKRLAEPVNVMRRNYLSETVEWGLNITNNMRGQR